MTFEGFVAERRRGLFRFAVVLTGDPVLADELLADVLATVFERWAQVSAATNVNAYVRRMLVNQYLQWKRRRARTTPLSDLSAFLPPTPDPAPAVADRLQLAVELLRLPVKQRVAVVLRYYENLAYHDIAALLGSTEAAARTTISRALRRLRVQIDESGQPSPGSPLIGVPVAPSHRMEQP